MLLFILFRKIGVLTIEPCKCAPESLRLTFCSPNQRRFA